MSNAVTGLFRPLKIDDTTLFTFNFTSKGFQPVYIPNTPIENVSSIEFLGNVTIEKFPELKKWELPIATPNDINIESLIINEGEYKAGKLMQLNSAYPIVVGYKNFIGVGYEMNFGDPLSFREFSLAMSYTPKDWSNGWASTSDSSNLIMESNEQFHLALSGKIGKYTFRGNL
jgi:hypothetical protein